METKTPTDEAAHKRYYVNEVIAEAHQITMVLDHAKEGCNKIVFLINENPFLRDMLMDCFSSGREFDFKISEILDNGCCKVHSVHCAFVWPECGEHYEATGKSYQQGNLSGSAQRETFYIDRVELARKRTIMTLNGAKGGFNQIVFDYGDDPELKSILIGNFEAGRAFDFRIAQGLPNGQCKIDQIMRIY